MQPRISANRLGEYMTATPSRRRQILRDQKNPPPPEVARYRHAREAIADHLASGMRDERTALNRAQALRNDGYGSPFEIHDRRHCAEAIDAFLELCDGIRLDALHAVRAQDGHDDSVEIAGVRVVMRPDVLLLDPATQQVVGCVKLHFSRSQPLNEKAAGYVATALRTHLEHNLSGPGAVHPQRCYVADIATRSVFHAPKANKRRLGDLGAACLEIRDRWASV